MAVLKDILYGVAIEQVVGSTEIEISQLQFDSRKVSEGTLFVAIKGTRSDGHDFVKDVTENGAKAAIVETLPEVIAEGVTYIKVANSATALGVVASNFYHNPSSKLKLVGVTGTNGKTTVCTLLYKLFKKLGYNVGLVSTVENYINDLVVPATHTTPDQIALNQLLNRMVDAGCEYCFMEVSSHSVVQHRIDGLEFAGGVFTNITHDHLDFHKTFDNYIKAKKDSLII